jgi:hypothetical protein
MRVESVHGMKYGIFLLDHNKNQSSCLGPTGPISSSDKSVELLFNNRNWRPYIPMNDVEFHPKAVGERMPLHPSPLDSSPDPFPVLVGSHIP